MFGGIVAFHKAGNRNCVNHRPSYSLEIAVAVLFAAQFLARPSAASTEESVIYRFTGGNDGYGPVSSLISDSTGALYGTTEFGGGGACSRNGSSGCGTVFKLTPPAKGSTTWTETVIYAFQGGSADGANPLSSLVFDDVGNLYGTTSAGGAQGIGTAFRLTPSAAGQTLWTQFAVYSFKGGPTDGSAPYAGLTSDGSGKLYGSTYDGGQLGYGTVFELATNIYNPASSFERGWKKGANPNGRWSYGYSSGPQGAVTLFNTTAQNGINGPNAQYWLDPAVNIGNSPAAEYNDGPAYNDGNVSFAPHEFLLVAGIGGQYADLVFTAATAGRYSLVGKFRGAQTDIGVVVGVTANNKVVFESSIGSENQIKSFRKSVDLSAGGQVIFWVGPNGGAQNTGLSLTIANTSQTSLD